MNAGPVCLCTGYVLAGELAPNPEGGWVCKGHREVRLGERAHHLGVSVQCKWGVLERALWGGRLHIEEEWMRAHLQGVCQWNRRASKREI